MQASEGVFIKPPSLAELKNPAPEITSSVAEPKTILNLSLRFAIMIILSIVTLFTLLNVIALATLVWAASGFWVFLLIGLFFLVVDCLGLYAVLKVHPELLVAFGYGLVGQVVLNVIQFIVDLAVFGGWAAFAVVSVVFNSIFVGLIISQLYPLRRYGLELRMQGNALPPVVGLAAPSTPGYVPV